MVRGNKSKLQSVLVIGLLKKDVFIAINFYRIAKVMFFFKPGSSKFRVGIPFLTSSVCQSSLASQQPCTGVEDEKSQH